MADITAPRGVNFEGTPRRISGVGAAATVLIRGMILVVNSSGYLVAPTDAAGLKAKGIFTGEVEGKGKNETYTTGAAETPRIECHTGPVWLPLASVAQTQDGEYAYLADSGNLTLTAGSKTFKYLIEDVDVVNALALVDLTKPVTV
jgi:hypothetical protein